jgi:hypothetical protein
MLPMDWRPPTTGVLARLADTRVRQFWDSQHMMAQRLAQDARPPQPEQSCCERSGFLWDLAAVYPAGARWDGQVPQATIFDGPIVQVAAKIDAALTTAARAR